MMAFQRALLRLRSIIFRRRLEREMQEEMAGHLDRAAERYMVRGMSAGDARVAARREFGNLPYLQEQARDARGATWIEALRGDLRFAFRHFARTPGTTVTMLIVLVGGLTISTLLFTWVHAYANNPPPGVALADDLVRIRGSLDAGEGGRGSRHFGEEEFLEYRRLTGQFAGVAGWRDAHAVVGSADQDERGTRDARVSFVTENWFSVLGVRPALGPGLPAMESSDASRATVAVISHGTWVDLLDGSPSAIGSTVLVNGHAVTVVGVAPRDFPGFPGYQRIQLWMPLAARHVVLSQPPADFRAVARLRDGVRHGAATTAVSAVAERAATQRPELARLGPSADVVPLLSANSDPMFDRDVKLMSLTVGLLGLLVLLIACTNVSALLTGLATARRQEIAIRLSLGAARGRLIRQLLTESALLATIAGATALFLVWAILRAVTRLIPGMPFAIGITWPVLAFTFGIALAVGAAFGLSPALHATRLALGSVLRDSAAMVGASRGRLQRALVVAQIAFTQPLIVLIVALLLFLLRNYQPALQTDYADQVVTVSVRRLSSPGAVGDSVFEQLIRTDLERLRAKFESTPGVRSVATGAGHGWDARPYVVHGDDAGSATLRGVVELQAATATSEYFDVMGIPLVRGRAFAPGDVGTTDARFAETPVILPSDLARRLWGTADPLGRRLQMAVDTGTSPRSLLVVGVVDDPLARARRREVAYRIYVPPLPGAPVGGMIMRTSGAGSSLLPVLREIARAEVPDMVVRLSTLQEFHDQNARTFRMIAGGITAAGAIALLLSAVGLYAVVAFAVGQRTREIAVRIAVGARGQQVVNRFIGDGLRLSAIGLVIGLPVSLVGLNALMSAVSDIPSVPIPAVTTIAMMGVIIVAAAASWLPARHAASVDPAVTLRHE